jgi:hypothetical protein
MTTLASDLTTAWSEGYDVWNLRSSAQQAPLYNPTWIHLFRLYERVFWIGGATEERFRRLEEVEAVIQNYLLAGGRLLVNSPIRSNVEPTSPIFRWGPMDSISSTVQNGLLGPGGAVTPTDAAFPPLSNGLSYFMSLINPPIRKGQHSPCMKCPVWGKVMVSPGQPASLRPLLWPSQKALTPISTARYSSFYPCTSSLEIV